MDKQAYSVEQFAAAYQVGRTKAFAEIAEGRLKTYRVGRRRYISAHAAAEWQRNLEATTTAASAEESVQ